MKYHFCYKIHKCLQVPPPPQRYHLIELKHNKPHLTAEDAQEHLVDAVCPNMGKSSQKKNSCAFTINSSLQCLHMII